MKKWNYGSSRTAARIWLFLLVLILAIGAVVILRWNTIKQCSEKYDNDTPPMHFITSFIDSFTPADCIIPKPTNIPSDWTGVKLIWDEQPLNLSIDEMEDNVVYFWENEWGEAGYSLINKEFGVFDLDHNWKTFKEYTYNSESPSLNMLYPLFNFNDGFYHGHYEIFDNDNFVYIRYSIAPLISGYIADNENASTTIKRFNKNTKKLEAVGIFNGYLKFSDVKDGYLFWKEYPCVNCDGGEWREVYINISKMPEQVSFGSDIYDIPMQRGFTWDFKVWVIPRYHFVWINWESQISTWTPISMDNIITNYNSMLNDWYNDDFELNTTNRYTLTVNDWRNSQSGASLPKFELIFPSIGCVRGDGILVSDKDVYQAQDELTNAGAIGLARVPCYADEEALEQWRLEFYLALMGLSDEV